MTVRRSEVPEVVSSGKKVKLLEDEKRPYQNKAVDCTENLPYFRTSSQTISDFLYDIANNPDFCSHLVVLVAKMWIRRDCIRLSTSSCLPPLCQCLQPRGMECFCSTSHSWCSRWWHWRWRTPGVLPASCRILQPPTNSFSLCSRSSSDSHSPPSLVCKFLRTRSCCTLIHQSLR